MCRCRLVLLLGRGVVLLSARLALAGVMSFRSRSMCWLIYRPRRIVELGDVHRAWREVAVRDGNVLSDTGAGGGISGIRVVKAFNQEERAILRFGRGGNDDCGRM